MNTPEANEILSKHLTLLKNTNYSELKGYLYPDKFSVREFTGISGRNYRINIQASWVDKKEGSIKISVAVDDGGISYFYPLTNEFILTRYGGFAGDKNAKSVAKLRFPQWMLQPWKTLKNIDYKEYGLKWIALCLVIGIGTIVFLKYNYDEPAKTLNGNVYPNLTRGSKSLYSAIYSFRKTYSRWPNDQKEFREYVNKNKLDINIYFYQALIFNPNKDGSLSVQYSYDAGEMGLGINSFILPLPQ